MNVRVRKMEAIADLDESRPYILRVVTDGLSKDKAAIFFVMFFNVDDGVVQVFVWSGAAKEKKILSEKFHKLDIIGYDLSTDLLALSIRGIPLPAKMTDVNVLSRIRQDKTEPFDIKSHIKKFFKKAEVKWDFKEPEHVKLFCHNIRYIADLYIKYRDSIGRGAYTNVDTIEGMITPILTMMRVRGVRINTELLDTVIQELDNDYGIKEKSFQALVSRPELNIASPKEMSEVLLEVGIPLETTKTGKYSVSADSLRQYSDHAVVQPYLELRSLVTRIGTLSGFKDKISSKGYIHPEYIQVGADGTGRIYSHEPSIIGFPVQHRQVVIPTEGCVFIYFDIHAADLYVAAKLAGCKKLIELYEGGEDVHAYIADGLGHAGNREISKVVVYSLIYGSEGAAPARSLVIPIEQAQRLILAFFELFPEIYTHREKVVTEAYHNDGVVKTITGRPRSIDGLAYAGKENKTKKSLQTAAERRAYNSVVQGSVADAFKLILIRLNKVPGFVPVIPSHDSVTMETPKETPFSTVIHYLRQVMNIKSPELKFRYKCGMGVNWLDAHQKAVTIKGGDR